MQSQPAGRRLLVVVLGTPRDYHRAFLLRCREFELSAYDRDRGWQDLGALPWPDNASDVKAVLRTVREGLGLTNDTRWEDFEQRLAALEQSLSFGHVITSTIWDDRKVRLLEEWIQYVSQRWPPPPPGRFVIGFLCIELPYDGSTRQHAIEQFVKKLEEAHHTQDGPVLVTQRLALIRPNDVGDWSSAASQYLETALGAGQIRAALEAILIDVEAIIFDAEPLERSFREVYPKLRERLEQAVQAVGLPATIARTN